jgi:hypothetical protein
MKQTKTQKKIELMNKRLESLFRITEILNEKIDVLDKKIMIALRR